MSGSILFRHNLDHLKELGCKVAIDDFGTGYSSFGWLRDLPVEIIKIDRSFVTPLATDIASVHIVRSIVDLCKRLGFTVIAEGVETRTQADMLTALGVDRSKDSRSGPRNRRPRPASSTASNFRHHKAQVRQRELPSYR